MRAITAVLLAATCLGVAACSSGDGARTPAEDEARSYKAPDNTAMNQRDSTNATLTPLDQGESETDRAITQAVRQGINSNPSLSLNAKNVKIITVNSLVTLRGPVDSEEERTLIVRIAKDVGGVMNVDNQLEVAPPAAH